MGMIGATKELLRHGAVLFAGLTVVNAANYLFHVVVSRLLGPARYGALSGILAIFVWTTICAGGVQLVVARRVALVSAADDSVLPSLLQGALRVALLLSVVFVAASSPITAFLHLDTGVPALLLAAYMVPLVAGSVARGGLQGHLRFVELAIATAASTIVRLVVGVAAVSLDGGISGAVAASVVGEIVGVGLALYWLRPNLGRGEPSPVTGMWREILVAVAIVGAFWAVVNLDTFLVRHFVPGPRSGFYAAAAVAARTALFFPAAIAMVSFPRFAAPHESRRPLHELLTHSLLVAGVVGGGFAVVLVLARSLVVSLLFGKEFVPSISLLGVLAAAMAMLAVVNVVVHFRLAVKGPILAILISALGVEAAGIAVFHESLAQISFVMLAVSSALLLGCLVSAYRGVGGRTAGSAAPAGGGVDRNEGLSRGIS